MLFSKTKMPLGIKQKPTQSHIFSNLTFSQKGISLLDWTDCLRCPIRRHRLDRLHFTPGTKAPTAGGFPFAFPLSLPHKGDPFQPLLAAPLSTFSSSDSLPWGCDWWKEENKKHQVDAWGEVRLVANGATSSRSHCGLNVAFFLVMPGWGGKTDTSAWSDPVCLV